MPALAFSLTLTIEEILMLKLARNALLLMALTALITPFGLNTIAHAETLSPETVPGTETIDVKKAKELFDAGVLFVDSRSKTAFDAGRIPGAENVPLSKTPTDADYAAVKTALEKLTTPEKPVVMYCQGPSCPLSAMMATKAVEWKYSKIYYFRDGFPAWKAAGYTVE